MNRQTLVYVEDRRWTVLFAAFSVSLTAMFTYSLSQQWRVGVSPRSLFDAALSMCFWAVSGICVARIVRPLELVIDEDGFSLSNWRAAVPWADVEAFKITFMTFDVGRKRAVYRDKGPGIPSVGWTLKPGVPVPLHRRMNMLLAGVAGTIPFSMKIRPADLHLVLEEWRLRYTAPGIQR